MANLNRVLLIGRLTREPEVKTFGAGTKIIRLGIAVNNRKKNKDGQWVDEPVFLDVEQFSKSDFEKYLHKGSQVFIEGHLKLDQWTGKDGQKRSALKVMAEKIDLLDKREPAAVTHGYPSRDDNSIPF